MSAEERIAALPEPIRRHVLPDDPYWCYVPQGWKGMIVTMNEHLEAIEPNYILNQVKEKFSGLRYYTNRPFDPDDLFHIIVSYYENKSHNVCDVCGEWGQQVRIGERLHRLATRCDDHCDVEVRVA